MNKYTEKLIEAHKECRELVDALCPDGWILCFHAEVGSYSAWEDSDLVHDVKAIDISHDFRVLNPGSYDNDIALSIARSMESKAIELIEGVTTQAG